MTAHALLLIADEDVTPSTPTSGRVPGAAATARRARQTSGLARDLAPHVAAARDGDTAAFERLVTSTIHIVTSVAAAILRDRDLGADVAQDVYVRAWRGIGKLRQPESFLPWLRQLARNRAREILRQRIRHGERQGGQDADVESLISAVPDPRPSAIDRMVAAEDRAARATALAAAIDALPAASRHILLLYYGEQRSAPEVARQLEISADVVRQRLARARARIREALAGSPRPVSEPRGARRRFAPQRRRSRGAIGQ